MEIMDIGLGETGDQRGYRGQNREGSGYHNAKFVLFPIRHEETEYSNLSQFAVLVKLWKHYSVWWLRKISPVTKALLWVGPEVS